MTQPCKLTFDDDWRTIRAGGLHRRLSAQKWRLLSILRERRGQFVSSDMLLDCLYRDTVRGRPKSFDSCLRVTINQLRRDLRLVDTTATIRAQYGRGYALALG